MKDIILNEGRIERIVDTIRKIPPSNFEYKENVGGSYMWRATYSITRFSLDIILFHDSYGFYDTYRKHDYNILVETNKEKRGHIRMYNLNYSSLAVQKLFEELDKKRKASIRRKEFVIKRKMEQEQQREETLISELMRYL